MVKSIEECVRGRAKFAKFAVTEGGRKNPYCPADVERGCYRAADNNNVVDDDGDLRPLCKLKIELGKPDYDDSERKFFLSRIYKK